MSEITQKICLLGDFSVGKTSLIRRFVENQFSDQYLSTVGVKISRKRLTCTTDTEIKQVNLLVWDLEGNTKFRSITPKYLKGASGAIIVADLTRSNTLNSLNEHINLFADVNPQAVIKIAFNKSDLMAQEKLNQLQENYSNCNPNRIADIYTTSAKTGENVANIFEELSNSLSS